MGGTSCDVCLIARRRAALLVRLRDRVRPAGQRAERLDAHDRRRRRLDRLGRPRRLPPGRPAERGRRSRARLLRPRRRRRRRSPTPTSCSAGSTPASSSAGGCRSTPSSPRAALDRLGERARAAIATRGRLGDACASRTRTWRTRSASSPSSRASTRASFALVAFGGAGPTHAARSPTRSDMRRVLVPPRPGLCSAFGALAAQRPRRRGAQRLPHRPAHVGRRARRPLRASSRQQARARLRGPGRRRAQPEVRRSIAMRYQGQNYEQEVAVPAGELDRRARSRAVYADYGAPLRGVLRLPARRRSRSSSSASAVVATGEPPAVPAPGVPPTATRAASRRRATSSSPATASCRRRVVRREALAPGARARRAR